MDLKYAVNRISINIRVNRRKSYFFSLTAFLSKNSVKAIFTILDFAKPLDFAIVSILFRISSDNATDKVLHFIFYPCIKNLYDIIITNPYMFYDTVSSIESKINGYKDKQELARLINEDPNNLEIIHLC